MRVQFLCEFEQGLMLSRGDPSLFLKRIQEVIQFRARHFAEADHFFNNDIVIRCLHGGSRFQYQRVDM